MTKREVLRDNLTYMQAGASCFVGKESAKQSATIKTLTVT